MNKGNISIWRYSHFALAVSSGIFILLASFTGILLAIEPLVQKAQPFRAGNFNELNLNKVIPALKDSFADISRIKIDSHDFVWVDGYNADGNQVLAYVNPNNGAKLGVPKPQSEFFQWVTNFHRSLFLHQAGRIFVGIISFLLLLIVISGLLLLIESQRGVRRFFKPLVKDKANTSRYYHVVLARFSFIPIILLALTGCVLTLVHADILPEKPISHAPHFGHRAATIPLSVDSFPIFVQTRLSEVQSIEFPFSDDPEDYYTLRLKDRSMTIDQFTGEVLTEISYPAINRMSQLSLNLHTGRSSALWAVVLLLATINIIYFVFSGLKISLKRRANRIQNRFEAHQSEIILLIGSENGSTRQFGKQVYQQLLAQGQSCYLTSLNQYRVFPRAKHLIVMTSTYGMGEAPANAARFGALVNAFPQRRSVHFSVLGFGSQSYPEFCRFAFEAHNLLAKQSWALPLTEVFTVNDRSPADFGLWAEVWTQRSGFKLQVDSLRHNAETANLVPLTVVDKKVQHSDQTGFLLSLRPNAPSPFQSGDLLAIYPADDHRERLYSIGRKGDNILLGIKLYPGGLGSGLLFGLQPGHTLMARIVSNPHFHFPENSSQVTFICNGTGIAPFLGMLQQAASTGTQCFLYCGFRNRKSFQLYEPLLQALPVLQQPGHIQVALSREEDCTYVSHHVKHDGERVAACLNAGGVLMICGSLSMQKDVLAVLEPLCNRLHPSGLQHFQSNGQIKMDCY